MPNTIQLERPCRDVVSFAIPTPFPVGDVNVYLLEGDMLTLVDTGPRTDEAWDALISGVQAAGYRLSDLKQIVLTHFHEDHTGLAHRLRQETGAKVLAHPGTAVWLREEPWFVEWRNRFFMDLYARAGLRQTQIELIMTAYQALRTFGHPCEVDEVLADGAALPSHPDWRVVYTPGHSQTQLSLYRAADQTMILADHLIAHISSNAFLEPTVRPDEERVKPLIQYRAELQKLKRLPIRLGLPGHGEPVLQHAALIEKRLESQERRAQTIVELLAEKESTALELALELFPKHQDQLPLILSETIGHLDWLEAEVRIAKTTRDGVDRFFA